MNQKISLVVLFLVLTLAVYGCAHSNVSENKTNIPSQTNVNNSDLADYDQANNDLSQVDDINTSDLDF